jgi:CheY-like chemotaxis protein
METQTVCSEAHSRAVKQTILVVDDDPSVRDVIGRVLTEEGFAVQCAANGTDALGIATRHGIDLALLDLNMPVPNGWDTLERLTALNPQLAVIIITGRSNQLFTSLAAGVGALLEKPLDFPILLKTIAGLLAETPEQRLARYTGRPKHFVYHPSHGKTPGGRGPLL